MHILQARRDHATSIQHCVAQGHEDRNPQSLYLLPFAVFLVLIVVLSQAKQARHIQSLDEMEAIGGQGMGASRNVLSLSFVP